jgi:hypothetical protein
MAQKRTRVTEEVRACNRAEPEQQTVSRESRKEDVEIEGGISASQLDTKLP